MKNIFLFSIMFFSFAPMTFGASFPDVAEDHKNYQAIEFLDEKQIIKGYQDGTFGPDKLVNRAEALKMIIGALKISTEGKLEVLFPDVKKEDWYFPYVMSAKNAGIVNGYKDGKFKPSDNVNLAETLKILLLASKIKLVNEVKSDVFVDVLKDAWYAPHMLYARDHNILFSDDYGLAHPDQAMSRAAFAEIIYRMMTVLEKKGEAFPLDLSWSSYTSKTLPFAIKYDDKIWKLFENKESTVFLRPDKQYSQFSQVRIYPNSGVVTVMLDENKGEMVAEQYFANIKKAFPDAIFKKFKLKEMESLEVLQESKRAVDWYIFLKNNDVLVVYTEYGSGPLGFQLQRIIKTMLNSFEYREIDKNVEDYNILLSNIFEKVLVKGQGMSMLNTLPDKNIIETDIIGVGTGPVDYYYSEKANFTFKYERSDDVILDSREGNSTKF